MARALVGAILRALCVRAAAALFAALCGGEILGLVSGGWCQFNVRRQRRQGLARAFV